MGWPEAITRMVGGLAIVAFTLVAIIIWLRSDKNEFGND